MARIAKSAARAPQAKFAKGSPRVRQVKHPILLSEEQKQKLNSRDFSADYAKWRMGHGQRMDAKAAAWRDLQREIKAETLVGRVQLAIGDAAALWNACHDPVTKRRHEVYDGLFGQHAPAPCLGGRGLALH